MSNDDIDKNLIEGHEYDGIQELDNPLPNWWLFTFYGTIIFGALYYLHYMSLNITLEDELSRDMAAITELQEKAAAESGGTEVNADQLAVLLKDTAAMAKGKEHYMAKCAVCHGQNGEGLIGPNMTDNFFIYGKGEFPAVVKVIRDGTPKGMPPWKGMIPDNEILAVTAYVSSLLGSNPANAKAPEGEEVTQ